MKRIILFDTAIATQNKGDEIIMESVKREMRPICEGNFVHHFPTHTVAFPVGHQMTSSKAKLCKVANYKFICGTNLFWTNMIHPNPLLNVNLFNCKPLRDSVLLGVGYDEEQCKGRFGAYSKSVWKKVLSKKYVHSVRDDQMVEYLAELGIKGINTGCPTLWKLTPEHCEQIPVKKADKVVFTLSSTGGVYKENDQALIKMLLDNYEEVYFYSQTYGGYVAFKSYEHADKIKVLEPDLEQYKLFLQNNNVDYVGTRLHGGVYAMQQKCRAIILSVDNRAKEFDKYHINCMDQFDIQGIKEKINSDFATNVTIDYDVVHKWMNQFLPKDKKFKINE
ncbi:MAG: polysaccharide pyruvyl transferase family protein [Lachnospiraceae bacterium]|nr:polysaccharide pyruvyl transferase family protein [Lachnospiraceae bacterium]